jgi:hypothetical protein
MENNDVQDTDELSRTAGRAALVGGGLGLASLVAVLAGEISQGEDYMSTGAAELAGWAGFVSASLLVVGLVGVGARYGAQLGRAGRVALLVLAFAAAVVTGATSTLALVVPDLIDRVPELTTDPPTAVPATFILGGLVLGVSSMVLAVSIRRAAIAPRWVTTLLTVGAVVSIVPLPSRFFLVAVAVGCLLVARSAAVAVPEREPALG